MKLTNKTKPGKSMASAFESSIVTMPKGQRNIFEAAVDEFAERGFAGSSTLAIAERAGVSEGLIFKYFKNKASLLRQVVFPILAATIMPLAIRGVKSVTDAEHQTFAEFIEALVRERLNFARQHKKHLRILLQELPLNEELRARVTNGLQAELLPILKKKIAFFQKRGLLRTIPTNQMMSYMIPQVMGFVLSRAVFAFKPESDEEQDIKTFITVMLHGVSAPTQAKTRGKK